MRHHGNLEATSYYCHVLAIRLSPRSIVCVTIRSPDSIMTSRKQERKKTQKKTKDNKRTYLYVRRRRRRRQEGCKY